MVDSAAQLFLKKVIAGQYYVDRLIGEGSFAWVYHAYSQKTGLEVAIKVLHSTEPTASTRFAREIEVLKAIPKNPYVVGFVEHGRTKDGWPILVIEYVDGITLRKGMTRCGVLAPEKAVSFLAELCQAFVGIHQLGVAHRDVKPENILLERKGGIKLIDFGLIRDAQGLLKLLEQEDPFEQRNVFSQELDQWTVAGTPEYMAPEQFSDAKIPDLAQAKTDTWSDVFSLGVIFYQLLSGLKPFPMRNVPDEDYPEEILRYMRLRIELTDEAYVPCPGIDEGLDSILRKALRQDPRSRQPDSRALMADLIRYERSGVGVIQADEDSTQMVSINQILLSPAMLTTPAQPLAQVPTGERQAFSFGDDGEDVGSGYEDFDDEDETQLDVSPEVLALLASPPEPRPRDTDGGFFGRDVFQDTPPPQERRGPTIPSPPSEVVDEIDIDIEGFGDELLDISIEASGSVLFTEAPSGIDAPPTKRAYVNAEETSELEAPLTKLALDLDEETSELEAPVTKLALDLDEETSELEAPVTKLVLDLDEETSEFEVPRQEMPAPHSPESESIPDLRDLFGQSYNAEDWREMTPTTMQDPDEMAALLEKTKKKG